MKILIACEMSGIVTSAFRERGHEAWSCDVIDTIGKYPEYHIKSDVLSILDDGWDLMIAHPPCTMLCNSGVCHLYKDRKKENGVNNERWGLMLEGAEFFKSLLFCNIPRICIENPIMHGHGRKIIGVIQNQVIQPWMFGHMEKKATCLWLKGLPKLIPSTNLKDETNALPLKEQQRLHYMSPSKDRGKLRSLTYTGIAEQMSIQWG